MEYQRATQSAQKEQSRTPSSSPHQTSLNHIAVHPLLKLQRTIGNQAVLNMLRSQNTQIDASTQAFRESRFSHDFSRIPIHSTQTAALQTKLTVNQPGDVYEQEADRIAEQVMRMPKPTEALLQRQCACAGSSESTEECAECKAKRGATLQRSIPNQETALTAMIVPPIVYNALSSPSHPLDTTAREFMEPRFGYDFSKVRVHTDERAADSALAMNALAYTLGRDVMFGQGQYAPETGRGRRLLAHELMHVAQQGAAEPITSGLQGKTCAPEAETGSPGTIQTRPVDQAANSTDFKEYPGLTVRPLSVQPMIQRDFALEQPHPLAVPRVLNATQMQAAITFNNRVLTPVGAGVLRALRDVLGVSPDPAVVDEDFVNAVVSWQAGQGLIQDGKLGPATAAPLFREIGAEEAGEGRLKSGPTYSPGGTIAAVVAGGAKSAHFALRAEFDSDPAKGIFPSCCEVRQFIRWDAASAASFPPGTGVPHAGFPAGTAAGTWIEDRDAANHRYGHRSGPFSDPQSFDQYLDATGRRNQAFGEIYRGTDDPTGPAAMAGQWRFMIRVIDVCKGGRTLGTEDFIRVNW